ncbi:MAG: nucleotidyltransferase domain-containing protein [Deltaproteobacteria bacterium]|nr:nucleotidyltransferase domain-containing protein [Deltaproteobacteria bacterium]
MTESNRNITAFEARTHLGEHLDYIRYSKKPIFIERHGKPVAALIDIGLYHQLTEPKEYRNWIEKAVEQIKTNYQPQKIILFGSAASGELKEGSDIDLLIIKKTQKRKLDRVDEVLDFLDVANPVELHIYTPKELEKRLAMEDPFIQQILKEGKILYETKS